MNIKDVAALARVSPATVSRCLNNTGVLNKDTRARIEKIVALTGYDVNFSSKKMDWNHNPTIGVMIPSLLNPVFSEIVAGIQQRARHFGYSVIVVDTQYECSREKETIVDLIRQRVMGIILTTASIENNEALSILREFSFSFCLVHNQCANEPCVYVDNYLTQLQEAVKGISGFDLPEYCHFSQRVTGYQLIGLDTSVLGCSYGKLTRESLSWLS